jgi:hypothetical protein
MTWYGVGHVEITRTGIRNCGGLEEVRRREFVPDEEIEGLWKRFAAFATL